MSDIKRIAQKIKHKTSVGDIPGVIRGDGVTEIDEAVVQTVLSTTKEELGKAREGMRRATKELLDLSKILKETTEKDYWEEWSDLAEDAVGALGVVSKIQKRLRILLVKEEYYS